MLQKRLKEDIEEIAKKFADEMSQREVKHKILNPEGKKSIMKTVKLDEDEISSTVKQRVVNYIKQRMSSQEVCQKFFDLRDEVISFFVKTSSKIASMEDDWIKKQTLDFSKTLHYVNAWSPYVTIAIATSPIWITAVIAIGAAFLGICAAISPIALPVWLYRLTKNWKKEELIDKYYSQYQGSIKELINNEFEANTVMKKMITNVTEEVLPRRLLHLETIINQLSISRTQILANQERIANLFIKLEVIMKSATSLEEWVKHI